MRGGVRGFLGVYQAGTWVRAGARIGGEDAHTKG
jgi:hypothetical protein